MTKPRLLYYVHAHGFGHMATFSMLYPSLRYTFEVVALTTNKTIADRLCAEQPGLTVELLPPKWPTDVAIPEHTYSRPFEVTPYAVEPAQRAEYLAHTIQRHQPVAFYCDGSPELAIMVRGMGTPVVLVHLPGDRTADPTQVFSYELADHIIAHYPQRLNTIDYRYADKTYWSGYLSRYKPAAESRQPCDTSVTILMGSDNFEEKTLRNITSDTTQQFVIIGNNRVYDLGMHCRQLGRVADISKVITGRVVISAAGQNSIAELLALKKNIVIMPEPRPYDEQAAHAAALASAGVALRADQSFTAEAWADVIQRATRLRVDYSDLINPNAANDITDQLVDWYV